MPFLFDLMFNDEIFSNFIDFLLIIEKIVN